MSLESVPLWLQGLFTATVTWGAGLSLFVFALNRQLSFVEFLHRRVLVGWILVVLACGAASGLAISEGKLAGLWLRVYLLFPGSLLLALLIGEVRLTWQRWYYRGSKPRTRDRHQFDGKKLVQVEGRENTLLYQWRRPVTTMDLEVSRYDVNVQGLPLAEGSSGGRVKVVQLSDFHLSPRLPFAYFRSAVELAMQEEADLVLLTGDFVTFPEDANRLPELFEGLRGRLGNFATLGNHDYWTGSKPVVQALRRIGVHLITNDWVRVPIGGGRNLLLCGIDDPWGKPPWQPPPFQDGELNLIISHSADNIFRLITYPFAGVFSGHFHGGQARLPGFGPLVVPSRYGRRFDHGHFKFKNTAGIGYTHLFVSAGVGSAMPLLRIYCQPEIIVVNFEVAPQLDWVE